MPKNSSDINRAPLELANKVKNQHIYVCVYIRRRKNIEIEPSIIILHKKHYTHIYTHKRRKKKERKTHSELKEKDKART